MICPARSMTVLSHFCPTRPRANRRTDDCVPVVSCHATTFIDVAVSGEKHEAIFAEFLGQFGTNLRHPSGLVTRHDEVPYAPPGCVDVHPVYAFFGDVPAFACEELLVPHHPACDDLPLAKHTSIHSFLHVRSQERVENDRSDFCAPILHKRPLSSRGY